ncbi:hypothetical protein EBB79_12310 [Parasedimentitalea marina]|uniref:Uncharacterized protein n=1 Tax=Parasedimentitalea marina TaxID=2483033 RepID=A0A3T0N3H8_9RHOB|nr:glycine zipper domain-containing protein [Parasedimentitalea marina]AZV78580.1 hypothetical protein EBB79_12310 [Parasedimentitalea marina]
MTGKFLTLSLSLLLLAGCDETVPVGAPLQLNGQAGANFAADEAQCRSQARQVGTDHIAKSAALGGVGGAIVGAGESRDKAAVGALVGAAVGAAVGDAQVKQAQRNYLVRCMQQAGHPVVG